LLAQKKSFAALVGGGATQWDHFHVMIPANYVVRNDQIATLLGSVRTSVQTTTRALTELTADAAETVLDLIANGSLYRGDEMKYQVSEFLKLKKQWDKLPIAKKDTYV
jgi:hypothetical protein